MPPAIACRPPRGPRSLRTALRLAVLGAAMAAATVQAQPARPDQPEADTGQRAREAVSAHREMVVTANPHASRAGLAMLARGGSALDAAIAAQMVLGLVEPQSSGIGGGAFLMHFEARSRRVQAWDGRETAPAAADATLLQGPDGRPLPFAQAAIGGRAVGVPGLVRMLEAAHARHGRLPWATLFEPAIRLATEGFEISPRLAALVAADRHLGLDPAAARLFHDPSGRPWPAGHRLANPEYADTLARIAQRGSLALHTGPIARDIVAAVRGHARNPGLLTEHDLAFYRPVVREPLCAPFRGFTVCGMPPPSSGGLAVAQILGLLEAAGAPAPARRDGRLREDGVHAFAEAARLAFADRDHYVADPDAVPLPQGLLDPDYIARRAASIGERSMERAAPGTPSGAAQAFSAGPGFELPSTTHLSVVDAAGNAVSMTSSIEDAFGARLMVRGFLLNNQLTDFAFSPGTAQAPVANRVGPGKRPRSSMAPTLVFRNPVGPGGVRPASPPLTAGRPNAAGVPAPGPLAMVIGSPGGSQIIGYVARSVLLTLGEGLPLQQVLALPHAGSRNGPTELEAGRVPEGLAGALRMRGHTLRELPMTSGLHGIVRHCEAPAGCRLEGAADPRREGQALGR